MAAIGKSGTPSPCSTLIPPTHRISELVAGEALAAGDAVYVAATGKVLRSTGAAANAAAKVDGFAAMAASINEAVTLITDCDWHYGAGLTPGARLFLSGAVAGGLDDVASIGGTAPIGFALDATRVRLFQSRY